MKIENKLLCYVIIQNGVTNITSQISLSTYQVLWLYHRKKKGVRHVD